MPLSRNTAFGVGAWKPSDGFFNLDERLAKIRVAAGLTLPLAPRPIFMADHRVINHTVFGQFAFTEAYIRERFLEMFRGGCTRDGSGSFLVLDSGSNVAFPLKRITISSHPPP